MAPVSGTHTISVRSDDGTRLWLNGEQLINDWVGRSAATSSNTVTLSAGVAVPIRLGCFDRWGQAVAALSWTRPDGTAEVIPTRFLFPADLAP